MLTQLLELDLVLVLVLVLALILIFFVHCLVYEDEEHTLKHDLLSVKGQARKRSRLKVNLKVEGTVEG